ncbi:MAG: PQQ-dependent sugar dehydrogenase [Gammaproteobacteria bacterium]|nr:PQQ-dependent sugar dehydrogenase [Gammaproteobacteria bacterium]
MTLTTLIRLLLGIGMSLTVASVLAAKNSAEQHLKQITLPPGFVIGVFAEVPGARSMALGESSNTVFVGTMGRDVYAVVHENNDGQSDKVVKILRDLKVPNGVAVHQGYLYVAEQNQIARYPIRGRDPDRSWERDGEVIFRDLPDKSHHGWRYIAFGPDNKLYVTVGIPCNICDPRGIEATIIRMDPDGKNVEVFARGIRNSVGLAFSPKSSVLYFTDNNTDLMGDDIPPCEFNAAPKSGLHFGFPYFAGGSIRHEDWANKAPPVNVQMPRIGFQAHVAPLGIAFYTGDMFPKEYRFDAFVAQHGSWNRSIPVGYRIVRVKFDRDGEPVSDEVFADGWLQGSKAWGRPVDVLQMPDGALLVSDDHQGVIYRITYTGR